MSTPPLIHVVDDDESLRTALLRLLREAGFEVRGHASPRALLLDPLPDRPGCVLLDLRLPGPSGLDLQAALRRRGAAPPVVFLTGHGDVATTAQAMKAGAVDVLTKPVEREDLFDAIRRALERNARQRAAHDDAERLQSCFAALTAREREIVDLVVSGMPNREVARRLGIAERTVKLHRATAMDKLGAGSAAELGRLAERLRRLSDAE